MQIKRKNIYILYFKLNYNSNDYIFPSSSVTFKDNTSISRRTWKSSLYYQQHLNTEKDDRLDTGQLGDALYEGTRVQFNIVVITVWFTQVRLNTFIANTNDVVWHEWSSPQKKVKILICFIVAWWMIFCCVRVVCLAFIIALCDLFQLSSQIAEIKCSVHSRQHESSNLSSWTFYFSCHTMSVC